ncbi:iron-containing alcohol dehydrogenase family protein [Atribacter laminatus]|uniref:Alcohol dehydrogenase n=1 Tax=Atribacter laminatus TaxID=2847778 RepID=A0A7T1AJQ4_ATRLM|nr:iron-containing alcohol dehydrogenase [Atribacter laminatus]QPM67182.1 Alcohol dehydrogenase [Atribacter laminatus]
MGDSFVFRLPREIFFGTNQGNDIGKILVNIGKRAIIITGRKSVKESGILDKITQSLDRNGLIYSIFDQVEPEPSLDTVNRGLKLSIDFNCEMVISLGGGSVLDCGKVIAGLIGNGKTIQPFFEGVPIVKAGVPWIALPTTAGTGSEMTSNSVLTDVDTGIKRSVRSPFLISRLVIIDPNFTLSMSPYLTAVSGIDALIQAIEAYTSPRSNPISNALVLEAIELLWKYLPKVVQDGANLLNREYVAKGSMLSAMGFANSSSGPAHGFSHLIGPKFSISHGETCAVLMPQVIRFNREVFSKKYLHIVNKIGIKETGKKDPAEEFALAFEDFLDQIHLRKRFKEFNVPLDKLISVLNINNIGKNITENPRPFQSSEMAELLKSSW